ncbi:MAG: heme transporter CcmB [Oscillospiraceae bacterium]|nr:heme transporter CcmB [Oscillospiraceae bacterium]
MKAKSPKILNTALLLSFVVTILVPLTGIHIHKLASVLFLLLSIIHTIAYRKKLGTKRYLLLALVLLSFATGLFGMILDQWPIVLVLHKVVSIAVVFFLAIHIFVFHKRMK